jgi:ubiquinone/menaquinone biosynthesis C-methylase UbiE
MDSIEKKAQTVFGERASFYTTSNAHTDPQALGRVVALAEPRKNWAVLDIATGTGHTAFAVSPHVNSVVGVDLTVEMLTQAERLRVEKLLSNVVFQIADAHELPFQPETFDLVTCRRAAHHFSNIRRALREMRRVLRIGGKVIIDDRSVPEDDFLDACMNLLDTYHDESHVRQYRASEWQQM